MRACGRGVWHTPKWHAIGGREKLTLSIKANSKSNKKFPCLKGKVDVNVNKDVSFNRKIVRMDGEACGRSVESTLQRVTGLVEEDHTREGRDPRL